VLGEYSNAELVCNGHVTLGVSRTDFEIIKTIPELDQNPFNILPSGNENAVWIEPTLVCTVKFMMKTSNGSLRQPVFKELRDDKDPKDCIMK
jgi:bifunctional non-homologous end joining protein LigD